MLSIILPTYKEKDNLKILIPNIAKYLKNYPYNIIIIDDNSKDGTKELCYKLKKYYPLKIIQRNKKLGLSSAMFMGLEKSNSKYAICMDADNSHPAELLIKIIAELELNYDLVIAYRKNKKNMNFFRKSISNIGESIVNNINPHSKDCLSGFFGINKNFFNIHKDKFKTVGFKLLLEIFPYTKKISNVPYVFGKRIHGKSKISMRIITIFIYQVFLLYIKKFLAKNK